MQHWQREYDGLSYWNQSNNANRGRDPEIKKDKTRDTLLNFVKCQSGHISLQGKHIESDRNKLRENKRKLKPTNIFWAIPQTDMKQFVHNHAERRLY
jgi:hypothetical protein